jgi:hypothetical protein
MRGFAAFTAGDTGFFGRKLVRGAPLVSDFAAFAAGEARFLGGKLMGGAFFMGGFSAATCDRALFGGIHRSKPATIFLELRHGDSSLRRRGTIRHRDLDGRNLLG